MKNRIVLMLLPFCFSTANVKSQPFNLSHIQVGASLKLQVILNDNRDDGWYTPTVRLGANVGVGAVTNFYEDHIKLLPAYNFEALFYVNGMGSNCYPNLCERCFSIDFTNSVTITTALYNKDGKIQNESLDDLSQPLYYFSNHLKPALINPFDNSFTFGYNFVTSTSKWKFSQRLGFIDLKIHRFQMAYFNDGGPVLKWLGDRKDRNYTAGLVIAYGHKQEESNLNRIELTYHKYTGYDRNNFEISSKLDLSHVDYIDSTQRYFNRSKWSLQGTGFQNRLSMNIDGNNFIRFDLQHLIHWLTKDPYHMVPLKNSIAVGASAFLFTKPYFIP